MNSASVGFQCPSCVKDGARSTRSGQLRFGGTPSANPHATTIGLIAVNVAVWLLVMANGGAGGRLFDKLGLLPLGQCQASDSGYYPHLVTRGLCNLGPGGTHWVDGVASGAWWQPITSAFTHAEPLHIGFNMVALWFLGPILEMMLGRARYLGIYLVSALAGSAGVMLFSGSMIVTVGASGAIFGLLGALIVVGLKLKVDMRQLWFWLGINVIFTFTMSNISWQGHAGGLIGGALAAAALVHAPRARRTPVQWGALGALCIVSVVLIAARATALG